MARHKNLKTNLTGRARTDFRLHSFLRTVNTSQIYPVKVQLAEGYSQDLHQRQTFCGHAEAEQMFKATPRHVYAMQRVIAPHKTHQSFLGVHSA